MNSMTGFGRGEAERGGHCITVELKSVNHRYLDMNIRTPRTLLFLEDFIRAEIKRRLARGRVDVFVNDKQSAGQAPGQCGCGKAIRGGRGGDPWRSAGQGRPFHHDADAHGRRDRV